MAAFLGTITSNSRPEYRITFVPFEARSKFPSFVKFRLPGRTSIVSIRQPTNADPSISSVAAGIVIDVRPDSTKARSQILFSFDESANMIVVRFWQFSKHRSSIVSTDDGKMTVLVSLGRL
jgi:hypothetical protein